jgi:prolyl oligopeptidase
MNDVDSRDAALSDPYLWLEDVTGERALDWVRERNAATGAALEGEEFAALKARILEALNSDARIPTVVQHGAFLYNFWNDAANPRGVWRRTTSQSYRTLNPVWETVLDVDALGAAEGVNWVWQGSVWWRGDTTRCLVSLSRGGADANEVREFDVIEKRFVDGGFKLLESKGSAQWLDADTLLIARDFGANTLTTSGYPRQIRVLKRGVHAKDAPVMLEIDETDTLVWASMDRTQGREYVTLRRYLTIFSKSHLLWRDETLHRLELPEDVDIGYFGEHLLVSLRTAWQGFSAGSLIATNLEDFLNGKPAFTALFTPSERRALGTWATTQNHVVLTILENVRTKLEALHFDGTWHTRALDLPAQGTAQAWPLEAETSDILHVVVTDDLTPNTLLEIDLSANDTVTTLKATPAFFDATTLQAVQLEATSRDGTRIPYTVLARKDAALNGMNPTVLYGYGGFEVSLLPTYSSGVGIGWLERGGVYVVANIRGGGEFGPDWHNSALKENRQRCYDDFIAVAEDLIARGYTSSSTLGISGGSNGGLLVGAVMTQRPDLFSAVSCAVPLLDMRRYHLLLAGASWMSEYGDPDKPEEWAYISQYSPYQNLEPDKTYPPVLFTTSTRDDRVHPGHARKMTARMLEYHQDAYLYENIEGGHAGAADNAQMAHRTALVYRFFWNKLLAAGS